MKQGDIVTDYVIEQATTGDGYKEGTVIADLRIGQTLNIPSRVGGAHYNAGTYAPYDPAIR